MLLKHLEASELGSESDSTVKRDQEGFGDKQLHGAVVPKNGVCGRSLNGNVTISPKDCLASSAERVDGALNTECT
jgi:hypothetical protein